MAQSHQPEIYFCLSKDLNANVQKNISSILHLHICQSDEKPIYSKKVCWLEKKKKRSAFQ